MNPDELKFYQDNGYLILRGAVTGRDLDALRRELLTMQTAVETGAWRGNHLFEKSGIARVIFNPYDNCPTLRDLVGRDDMIDRAKAILGTAVQLDHTKLMCKVARDGSAQPPHQDYFYWQGNKANQVAVFVCLDACDEANGCLRVVPGSHKRGLLEHHEEYHETTGERHWVCPYPDEVRAREVKFLAEPGDAVFFGSLTVHRSDGNTSQRHRRAVVFEYDEKGNLPQRPGWGAPTPAAQWD
ncbi:MAG: phytanoyl-CoA dioxygenase family protein [Phycisphaeraceae bacterium]|nr:phytanoyl-CoA dioxygenase family protein [Phycisphaeraceae bacterium]